MINYTKTVVPTDQLVLRLISNPKKLAACCSEMLDLEFTGRCATNSVIQQVSGDFHRGHYILEEARIRHTLNAIRVAAFKSCIK